MKVMAFSDLHLSEERAAELVAASADADLVIGAGDFCNMRQGLARAMEMLAGIAAPVVMVPGNAESAEELRGSAAPSTIVLHGAGAEIGGLRLFGLGGGIPETPFGDWSFDLSEREAARLLSAARDVDILITHSPPEGAGDTTSAGVSIGSQSIRAAVERLQPRLVVFGHVHDCWGYRGQIGASACANLGPTPNWFEVSR
ncbi:metallophosphoesterase [Phaeobacter sp. B1627]|uniref:metallophosphoesterase family protein n=1 Tax=Phaeobacter sp. B1627 TaxID=2583809 RepID=UPI0011181F75|nr:metallophosphoesterase [Phaeobacter sp. B1627]TNJ47620.1 serine/threonine protein phosphatase [Phaeobacter sp. B1627]